MEWPWRNTCFTSKHYRPHKCLVAIAYSSNSIHVCRLGIKSVVTSMMFSQEDIHEWHYSDRTSAHWNIDRESLILPLLVFRISTGMDNPLCSRRNEKIASNLKVEELLNKKTYPFQSPQNDRIRGNSFLHDLIMLATGKDWNRVCFRWIADFWASFWTKWNEHKNATQQHQTSEAAITFD